MSKRLPRHQFVSRGWSRQFNSATGDVIVNYLNTAPRAMRRRAEWLDDGCDNLISAIRDSLNNESRFGYNPYGHLLDVGWRPASLDLMPDWTDICALARSS